MLLSLHIENMAVIRTLDIELTSGLCAITGETGAGKSVMIDCLSFLLGARPARELVRSGEVEGCVSGFFTDVGEACTAFLASAGLPPTDELLLQRTLTAAGKSQCRLNGRIIPQSLLREIAGFLVSIHGQNDNQLLLRRGAQAEILDGLADLGDAMTAYRAAFQKRSGALGRLQSLGKDDAEKNRLRDILRFQIDEIDAAKLRAGEEEELEHLRARLQNAERIAKHTELAFLVLHGSEKSAATLQLDRASRALAQLAGVLPQCGEFAARLSDMRYEIEDVANTVRDLADLSAGDPTKALDKVESRLDTIAKLRRKYGADIAEILAFREKSAASLASLENADEEIAALQREIALLEKEMRVLADTLHEKRAAAASLLSERVRAELAFLDMPAVRFDISLSPLADFGAGGTDEVEFLIATNKGEPLAPLSKIASGGELARVMLALKSVLNTRDGVGTAVFDEVDTGISGKTARKIGIKLCSIGRTGQVISVTHSAQIASLAHAHYKIEKHEEDGRVVSGVTRLDEQGRIDEIARILGGLSVTDAQLAAAREMIEEGRAYQ